MIFHVLILTLQALQLASAVPLNYTSWAGAEVSEKSVAFNETDQRDDIDIGDILVLDSTSETAASDEISLGTPSERAYASSLADMFNQASNSTVEVDLVPVDVTTDEIQYKSVNMSVTDEISSKGVSSSSSSSDSFLKGSENLAQIARQYLAANSHNTTQTVLSHFENRLETIKDADDVPELDSSIARDSFRAYFLQTFGELSYAEKQSLAANIKVIAQAAQYEDFKWFLISQAYDVADANGLEKRGNLEDMINYNVDAIVTHISELLLEATIYVIFILSRLISG